MLLSRGRRWETTSEKRGVWPLLTVAPAHAHDSRSLDVHLEMPLPVDVGITGGSLLVTGGASVAFIGVERGLPSYLMGWCALRVWTPGITPRSG